MKEDTEVATATILGFILGMLFVVIQVNDLLFSGNPVFSLIAVVWCLIPYLFLRGGEFREWLWGWWMGEGYKEEDVMRFAQRTAKEISESASKITDGFVMMSGVYAILLAFVVSDKASLAFSSWGFLAWVGWVLAIIIHFVSYSSKMIQKGLRGKKVFAEQVYYAKEFFRLSGFMMLIAVAIIPAFSIFPLLTMDQVEAASYYWGLNLSLISVVSTILCITGLFWLILNSRLAVALRGAPLVLDIVFPLFSFMLSAIFISPLGVTIISAGGSNFVIPNAALFLVEVPFVFGWPIPLMRMVFQSKKKKHKKNQKPHS